MLISWKTDDLCL